MINKAIHTLESIDHCLLKGNCKRCPALKECGGDMDNLLKMAQEAIMGLICHTQDMEQGKYEELRKKRIMVLPCEMGETVYIVVMKKDGRTRRGYSILTRRAKLNKDNLYKVCINYGKWVFSDYESAKAEEIRIRNMTKEEQDAYYRTRAG